jgi:hypothetical protein
MIYNESEEGLKASFTLPVASGALVTLLSLRYSHIISISFSFILSGTFLSRAIESFPRAVKPVIHLRFLSFARPTPFKAFLAVYLKIFHYSMALCASTCSSADFCSFCLSTFPSPFSTRQTNFLLPISRPSAILIPHLSNRILL